MKKILSISLGSSSRNAKEYTSVGGVDFEIERIGTDGNINKMKELFREYDGKVDAFGIGGFDLYIYAGRSQKIPFPVPQKIVQEIQTPVYDGSMMKLTLEPMVIEYVHTSGQLNLADHSAFCLVGSDRFGMAETLHTYCKKTTFGDLLISLSIPVPISNLKKLVSLTKILGPAVVKLPFSWLYPIGEKAHKRSTALYKYIDRHEIIAGDFHYIAKYRKDDMSGKIIITNTMTEDNIRMLRKSGVSMIIPTTPIINGRTFGTNIIEAMIASIIGKDAPTIEHFTGKIREFKLHQREALV